MPHYVFDMNVSLCDILYLTKGGGMMILVREAKRKTTKFWAKSETSMPPFTLCVQTLPYKKFVFPKTPPLSLDNLKIH